MIVRIVKMTFKDEKTNDFLQLFNQVKDRISTFEGCQQLELLQDINQKNIFFTYSIWESEHALNKYRFSDLFKTTWEHTKILFEDKPQAWSIEKIYSSNE